jgi:hypothetical protein
MNRGKGNDMPIDVTNEVYFAIVKLYGDPMSNEFIMVANERIDAWAMINEETYEVKSIKCMPRSEIIKNYYS